MNPRTQISPSQLTLAALLAGLLALLTPAGAGAAQYATALISEPGSAASQAAMSGDGRRVAYVGTVPGSSAQQVLVRDRVTGTVLVASRAPGHGGALGDDTSTQPSISKDGRYVAFASLAKNLSPDDDDTVLDVFRRDLSTGTTTLVSQTPDGVAGNRQSRNPDISADGRYVAFESEAQLDPKVLQKAVNVFVRDLGQNEIVWANRSMLTQSGEGAYNPSISQDGKRVVFDTVEKLIFQDDEYGVRDVYMLQLAGHTLGIVSRASGAAGVKANAASHSGVISDDGYAVAFVSSATNLSPYDREEFADVFVRQINTDAVTLLSVTGGFVPIGADAISRGPSISGDGRVVSFTTKATNLIYQHTADTEDVIVVDRSAGWMRLASRSTGSDGAPGNADSIEADLSADGRWVGFGSKSTNLGAGGGAESSVFARGLSDGSPWETPAPPETPGPGGGGTPGAGTPGTGGGAGAPGGAERSARPGLGGWTRLAAQPKQVGPRAAIKLGYALTAPSRLEVVLARELPGVKVGGRCKPAGKGSAGKPRCTRSAVVRKASAPAAASGQIRLAAPRRGWAPGAYRATVTATDADGASRDVRLSVRAATGKR